MSNTTRPTIEEEGEGRLGSLPGPLLVEILSNLPIKSAAATSVLSIQWRYLWTHSTNFSLICSVSRKSDKFDKFIDTVYHTLGQLTSPKLHAFSLDISFDSFEESFDQGKLPLLLSHIGFWITQICTRNPDQIKLKILNDNNNEHRCLPSCVFQAPSVVDLQLLCGSIGYKLPDNGSITLPNLKKLHLVFRDFRQYLITTLIDSCPLLHTLCLNFHRINGAPLIHISSPRLNCLTIRCLGNMSGKFVIDVPNLNFFSIHGVFSDSFEFVIYKPAKLTKAVIDSYSRCSDVMLGLLQGLTCAKSLALLGCCGLYFIRLLNLWDRYGNLPLFSELNELHIVIHLVEPLERYDRFPALMLTNVKKIKKEYLLGIKMKSMKLLEYILSNSFALELLSVCVTNYSKKDRYEKDKKLSEALFRLERSSENCRIQYTGKYCSASSSSFKSRGLASETHI